jgi:hypothetical protein
MNMNIQGASANQEVPDAKGPPVESKLGPGAKRSEGVAPTPSDIARPCAGIPPGPSRDDEKRVADPAPASQGETSKPSGANQLTLYEWLYSQSLRADRSPCIDEHELLDRLAQIPRIPQDPDEAARDLSRQGATCSEA